jgi:RND family efflux transporter MFP subunit
MRARATSAKTQAAMLSAGRSSRYVVLCCLLGLSPGCHRPEPAAPEKAPPATVKWAVPSTIALEEWTELVGTTVPLPDRAARVSAAAEGRVVSVLGEAGGKPVVEGQRIEKGTVLVQLDTSIVQANLAKAEAARDVLREEERQAQYAVELAASEVDRLRKLKEEEATGPPGRTPLVSAVDRLKADYALKDAQSKLKAANGRLVAGQRDEDALRAQMRLLTLSAPITGRVGRIQVVTGQGVAVGTTVAEVVDLDDEIDVLCFVPPSLVGRLRVGMEARPVPVEKEPDSAPGEGQIVYIAEQAEPETGNFAVKVRFNNKDIHLRANSVVRLSVQTQPAKECVTLPESAVSEDEETPTVVIVEKIRTEKNADGKEETVGTARRLQAVLGVRNRAKHQVEIVSLEDPNKEAKEKWSGAAKDQQYVVEGGERLQTEDKVKLEVEGD